MKPFEPSLIKNVALVGHGNCGKTMLTSAMLYLAGETKRLGSVDDGTTVTDYDPDEVEKKISLQLALAHLVWARTKVNLIDTPGYGNFIYEAKAALRVADGALVLIEAVSGVEVQTEKVWSFCDEFSLPRMVVVSRMDRDNASAERALTAAQDKFGRHLVPIQLPIGSEKGFRGVVDLVSMKAFHYPDDQTGKASAGEIPAELLPAAEAARRTLLEAVAELDDKLMERYLETETLETDEFLTGLTAGVRSGRLVPVVYAAGASNIGTGQVLDALVSYLPSPVDRAYPAKDARHPDQVIMRTASVDEPTAALVFKTIADPYAGKLSLVRVYSGSIKASDHVYNASREENERTGALYHLQGKTQDAVEELTAGDLGAIPKLKETTTNDSLASKDAPVLFTPISFPEPAMSFALEPKTRGDEDKLATSLHRIAEEDLTVHYGRDPQTNELLISGMGDTHVEVVVAKLRKKFGVDVLLKTPKVPYRETIKRTVEVQGKHKKQTGGRGQFADCRIRMEPLPRGEDFVFADEIFGGSIPHNFRPAVEKGIQEARKKGFLAGYPVVDFKVALTDGGFHPVDSSEIAFKIAGALAFRKGMEEAKAVLLEPVMTVSVEAPEENMGDIIGQLNSRRGRIQGMEGRVVTALVPMAEMLDFAVSLKALTSGRGNYHMEPSHYDEVPAAVAAKVIEATKREHEEQKD